MSDTVMWGGKGLVNIDNPDPATFDLPSICRALARKPRYGGFIENTVSVGQHTLLAVHLAEYHVHLTKEFQSGMWDSDWFVAQVLLHDFAEAYIGDVPKPIKHMPECAGIVEVESRLYHAICARWNAPRNDVQAVTKREAWPLMHKIDFQALNIEVLRNGSPSMKEHFKTFYADQDWTEDMAWVNDMSFNTLDRTEAQVVFELQDQAKIYLTERMAQV